MQRVWVLFSVVAAGCARQAPAESAPPASTSAAPAPVDAPPERDDEHPFTAEAIEMAVAYSADKGGHAVLVMHEGREVVSAWQNDWAAAKPHVLASGTKSFWGPVVVAAIDDGLLSGFDEVAADTITEWADDPRRSAITVRQLLSMTSGLEPDLGVTIEQVAESDMFALTVAAPAKQEPGAKWAYSDSSHTAVGVVLDRKLGAKGSSLASYVQERLLTPLGIAEPQWRRDAAGHLLMPSGARLTPAQWAAFGELVRSGGKGPDGTQLLSAEALAECFQPSKAPPAGQFYGLGWWLASVSSYGFDLPPDMRIAGGSGGQYLFVFPSRGVTIVRFGDSDDFDDGEFLCRLFHGTPRDTCPKRQ